MKLLEYLDRVGERRLERWRIAPRRPVDWKSFIGLAFLLGYYFMVYTFIYRMVPAPNVALVRDAMLVLGPAVGAIVQSLFRSDVRDEIQANNTGEGFRAMRTQAEATVAAVAAPAGPPAAEPPTDGLNDPERPAGTAEDPVHTTTERNANA